MIKSKKKTALVLALALVFSTTSGYAYGTSIDVGKNTHKIERRDLISKKVAQRK